MSTLAIQGCQWGDEGKGKVTDYYASKADIVVRSQGGNNAGHSIVHKGKRYALRLLPSGVFNPNAINILADNVVINPWDLIGEIDNLHNLGIKDFKILVSSRAPILMPYHLVLDRAREQALSKNKIGTTLRGIGPCYEDVVSRIGLRFGDLLDLDALKVRLEGVLEIKNLELKAFGQEGFSVEELYSKLIEISKYFSPLIIDTTAYLTKAIKEGKKVLFEGAQGAMLDNIHGTFPYVTSSSPLATAIPLNTGMPLDCVNNIIGIVKAYTTRVGEGPFPSEIENEELAHKIRETGHEYGTVTKRPRRIGWLDIPQLRYVHSISGVTHVAFMLLDVLSSVDEIKLCVSYSLNGKEIDYMPSTVAQLSKVETKYITLPSWKEDISSCRKYEDLPLNARRYIEKVEELTGLKATIVSVGPDKEETIIREDIF